MPLGILTKTPVGGGVLISLHPIQQMRKQTSRENPRQARLAPLPSECPGSATSQADVVLEEGSRGWAEAGNGRTFRQ